MKKAKGIVYLVGAGPGDAGLLTVRGAELLGGADVVVYDGLVNRELLDLAPCGAEIIYGGKRPQENPVPQMELNALLISKAKAGKRVVRLKGGDPYTFGRGGEEALELAEADVPFEVVPGVSSVVAVPNYAGIPLTHRDHCSGFVVVTGHEEPGPGSESVDWAQIAKNPDTKVIMMATKQIRRIAAALIENGTPPKTPAAMIQWGTTARQKTVEGTLATIADIADEKGISPPTVIVIGDVVRLRGKLNWFEKRPLFGKRIVVTRARDKGGRLVRQFRNLGADVMEIPTIRTAPPEYNDNLKDAILELNSYNWIVFTSPTGVSTFFEYFFKGFEDLRDFGGMRIAAVGPATASKIRELHLKVDLMPEEYTGRKIAEAFADYESIENLKILLMRAEVANPELPKALEEMGAIVDDVACYRTEPETADIGGVAARFEREGADWIVFSSGSTVENFNARFDLQAMTKKFPNVKLASIGPETSKAVRKLGLEPFLESKTHTIEGLVEAIQRSGRSH
ncbi:MAG: uroporphyrinogen-III C-methyltransferase [Verrucomicrobia bacterium]|nr:uroporphyrinogen-III C-methyltransferase [Verrucomicrobiota bacterium]